MSQTIERKRAGAAKRKRRQREREKRYENVLGVTLDLETFRDWAVETGRMTECQTRSNLELAQLARRIIETAIADSSTGVTRDADPAANRVMPKVDDDENEPEGWL